MQNIVDANAYTMQEPHVRRQEHTEFTALTPNVMMSGVRFLRVRST
jgi:hypothetical protein